MSTFDADTTTLLTGISAQLHTASTWMTGPRSAVLLDTAGQIDELLSGVSATSILGGPVAQQTDSVVVNAEAPSDVDVPALSSAVPSNVAPATDPSGNTPVVPVNGPDAPAG